MLPVMESMWLLESSALSCLAAAAEFDKASSGGERMEEERVEWRGADDSGPGVEWRLGAGAGAGLEMEEISGAILEECSESQVLEDLWNRMS